MIAVRDGVDAKARGAVDGVDEGERFGGAGGKIPISNRGGVDPIWSRDGHRLYYWQGRQIMMVEVDPEGPLAPSIPQIKFDGHYWGDDLNSSYDISPIDGRMLMIKTEVDGERAEVDSVAAYGKRGIARLYRRCQQRQ